MDTSHTAHPCTSNMLMPEILVKSPPLRTSKPARLKRTHIRRLSIIQNLHSNQKTIICSNTHNKDQTEGWGIEAQNTNLITHNGLNELVV